MCRTKSKATRKINFEENSQNFTISGLTEKSMEDTNISLQVCSACQSPVNNNYICIIFFISFDFVHP